MNPLRDRIFKSLLGRVGWSVYRNLRNRYQLRPGTTIALQEQAPPPEEEAGYVLYMFEDYARRLADLGASWKDQAVLELGPGDHFGIAYLCLAHGARQVTCIDKFRPQRDPASLRKLYEALAQKLSGAIRDSFEQLVLSEGGGKLVAHFDCPVEDAGARLAGQGFGLILSRSVLEYVKDSDEAFRVMDHLLTPGGIMVHKVDCRDDGLFTHYGHPPLTFLTLPEWLYRWMTSHTYRPNRRRISYYRRKLQEGEYAVHLLITHIMGQDHEVDHPVRELMGGRHYQQPELHMVRGIRPRLAREFRDLSDEDLLTAGFFLVGIKPDWPEQAEPVNA